ncbi:MAG: SAM-dependent methyltransferase [Nitrosomonadales bacterium]|nr:SAM-dependent methyltransferase [Nitrosomonadales bacterium]
MKHAAYTKALDWLKTNPALDELCARYPAEWEAVQRDIAGIVQHGEAQALKTYLEGLAKLERPDGMRQRNLEAELGQYVRSRMAHESVKKLCLSTLAADSGVKKGRLRFNLFNGFIAQKLLFAHGLVRKPVSLRWFRLLWPLVWQKKRLMPLVQPRGIYCFYSRELIAALSQLIADRNCLEIGAGDGTLTRFLKTAGVAVTATDNHGWSQSVQYPAWVIELDARAALADYAPEVVICSWPPAQNDFERDVFATPSVQLYIVIGSRHHFAFGNWPDYQRQSHFEMREDHRLAALLLPPELESAVYLFQRKAAST